MAKDFWSNDYSFTLLSRPILLIRPMRRAARLDPAEMKDARMFSTLEGAKKFAKNLKSLFEDSGIIFPLNRCQQAAAIAGGF